MAYRPHVMQPVLYCRDNSPEHRPVFPALVRVVHDDGAVDLTYFTPFGTGPVRVAAEVAMDNTTGDPAPGMWSPLPGVAGSNAAHDFARELGR